MKLDEFRKLYPEYDNIDDETLSSAIYEKNYSGKISRREFDLQIGVRATPPGPDGQTQPALVSQASASAPGGLTETIPDKLIPSHKPVNLDGTTYLKKFAAMGERIKGALMESGAGMSESARRQAEVVEPETGRVAGQVLGGAAMWLPSNIMALAAAGVERMHGKSPEEASETREKIIETMNSWLPQPETEVGQKVINGIGQGIEAVLKPVRKVGEIVARGAGGIGMTNAAPYDPDSVYLSDEELNAMPNYKALVDFITELGFFKSIHTGGKLAKEKIKVFSERAKNAQTIAEVELSAKETVADLKKEYQGIKPTEAEVEAGIEEYTRGMGSEALKEGEKPAKIVSRETEKYLTPQKTSDHDVRIQEKYADIMGLEEVGIEPGKLGRGLDAIDQGTATPETVKRLIRTAKDDTSVKQKIKSVIADKTGDLLEIYKYEGFEEGKALEGYIDSLLAATEETLPRSRVSGTGARTKAATSETPREIPTDTGITKKATTKKSAGPQTIRGRIAAMNNLNPGNMKGEVKSMPMAAQRMFWKKKGVERIPLDVAYENLKAEGWIDPSMTLESFIERLRYDPEFIKQGKFVDEGEGGKTKFQQAEAERVRRSSEREADEPPPGEYVEVNAEDLPEGKTITILDGKGSDGWDTYKIKNKEKDPFGGYNVTLEDGMTYTVDGNTRLQVLKSDVLKAKSGLAKQTAENLSRALEEKQQKGEVVLRPEAKVKPFTFEDKLEKNWQQAHGVKKPSIVERARNTVKNIGHKVTREFEYLPRGAEFAEAGVTLRNLSKQKTVAMEKAVKNIAGPAAKFSKNEFNLFERKVIFDDLVETAGEGKKLPFGIDGKKAGSLLKDIDNAISGNEKITSAVNARKEIWGEIKDDYIQSMKDIGFDVSNRLNRENYYRHQVLDYVEMKGLFGTGKRLKTPAGRGYLKTREGSALDINTNYLEAESEIMAQMLYDTQVARAIKRIDNNYNIIDRLRKEAKASGKNWDEIIPEGYVEWQPREGNIFYTADTIPAKMAEALTSGALEELGITKADIGKALAMGGKRRSFVIKEELAKTLDNMVKSKSENEILEWQRKAVKAWKVWQLVSPRRWPKYNFRNLTGDLDAVFAGNPSSLKRVPAAINDLFDAYVNKRNSADLQDFFERGGMGATLQAQELGDINSLKMFEQMLQKETKIQDLPYKVWSKYWKAARMTTDFREAILRYASYKDYLDQMRASADGKTPKNYGASMREEVDALGDIRDKAYMLSNDLLGAYDRISVAGQTMREHLFPFWSWKEANAKRYYRLLVNAATDGKVASTVGKKIVGSAIAKTPYRAYRIGSFMVKASALWAMLQVWNRVKYGDLEDRLPEGVRSRPHIILGQDDKGNIQYFSRLGALPDLLEWVGLDAAPEYIDRLSKGETPINVAREMAKSPANIFVSGSLPFTKMALELLARRSFYPDAFNPRTIRDRGLYIAQSFGLDQEYREIMDLPRRDYARSVEGAFIYKIDPNEAAYNETYNLIRRWQKENKKNVTGFMMSDASNALYNVKLSLRYNDKKSAEKYLIKFYSIKKEQGYTDDQIVKSFENSLEALSPLSALSEKDQLDFFTSLTDDEKMTVFRGQKFIQDMLAQGG